MMLTVFVCVCVSALMCIVKPDGSPQLCKTDEIGEIVINSRAGGTMYYGLPGVTKNTFEVCQSLKDMYDIYMSLAHSVCDTGSHHGGGLYPIHFINFIWSQLYLKRHVKS